MAVLGTQDVPRQCPITLDDMKEPMRNEACGHVYSKAGIMGLLKNKPSIECPVSGERRAGGEPRCPVILSSLLDFHSAPQAAKSWSTARSSHAMSRCAPPAHCLAPTLPPQAEMQLKRKPAEKKRKRKGAAEDELIDFTQGQ